jgi:hypothetical protein
MFKSISWQEYLYAIALISLGYYAVIIAVFYSRDFLSKFRGATVLKTKPISPGTAQRPNTFMGAISNGAPRKLPVRESIATVEEITVELNPEELIAANKADSPAAELYERIEELFLIMEGEPVTKSNYIKSIKTLIKQYLQFKDTPIQQEISGFITDQFKGNGDISFTVEEINTLWVNENDEIINESITKNNYEK